jgi:hypothetical protein
MTFHLLIVSLAATLLAIPVHVFWWRWRRPADDVTALIVLLCVLPFLGVAVWHILGALPEKITGAWALQLLFTITALGILHGTLGFVYINSYAAVQAASPTVLVLLTCDSREGATKEELRAVVSDDLACRALVHAGLDEGFFGKKSDRLHLAARGRTLIRLGRMFREFLGLHPSQG